MTPDRYILLLLLATFFAVLGVAQRAHVVHLGRQVGALQSERDSLARDNRKLLCDIGALSHPARIADEVGRLNIALMDPVTLTKAPLNEESGEAKDPKKPEHPAHAAHH